MPIPFFLHSATVLCMKACTPWNLAEGERSSPCTSHKSVCEPVDQAAVSLVPRLFCGVENNLGTRPRLVDKGSRVMSDTSAAA